MHTSQSRSLVERMAFNDLLRLSEPKRVVRSNTVTGPPLQIKAGTNGIFYIFNVKSHPSTTGLRHHGYIKFKKPRRVMPMANIECEVDCDCPDYRYTWAWVNKQRGASRVGPSSLNQAWNQAPRIKNPWNRPGLCKHLLALRKYLEGQMSNIGFGSPEDADSDVLDKMYSRATKIWTDYGAAMQQARGREAKYAARRDVRRQGQEPDTVDIPDTVADTEPEPPEAPEPSTPETPEPETPETPETPGTPRPPEEEEDETRPPAPPSHESLVDRLDGMSNMKQFLAELADEDLFGPDAQLPTEEPGSPAPEGPAGDEGAEDAEGMEDVEAGLDDINGEGEDEITILGQIRDELRKLNALANPNANVDAQPVQKLRN